MKTKIVGYNDYITGEGDTFDGLALKFYNEETLSSVLINANLDYADILIFEQGMNLLIPVVDIIETPETLPPWRRNV